jgi:hypothetical protein
MLGKLLGNAQKLPWNAVEGPRDGACHWTGSVSPQPDQSESGNYSVSPRLKRKVPLTNQDGGKNQGSPISSFFSSRSELLHSSLETEGVL